MSINTFHAFEHPSPHLGGIKLVYTGAEPRLSNFLGMYGVSPTVGWYWWAVDGDHGEGDTAEDCEREILNAWNGTGGSD